MAESTAQYKVTATVVKVAVGPADGNRVARFVERGDIIPDGVDQGLLKQLEKLGRIEKVKTAPAGTSDADKAAAAKAEAEAKAAADAKATADAKAASDAKTAAGKTAATK